MPYHVNNTENVAGSNRIVEIYLIVKVDYVWTFLITYQDRLFIIYLEIGIPFVIFVLQPLYLIVSSDWNNLCDVLIC